MSYLKVIQVLRALAAIFIVVLHSVEEAIDLFPTQSPVLKVIHDKCQLASGVDLFFIISGFVIVISSKSLFQKRWGWVEFFKRRIVRIVPMYWLATTLLLVVMSVTPSNVNGGAPTFLEAIKSYLFIPYVNSQGEIQPVLKLGWTLNYEMLFYLVFGSFLFLRKERTFAAVASIFLILVGVGKLGGNAVLLEFYSNPIVLEFIVGAALGCFYLNSLRMSVTSAILLVASGTLALVAMPSVCPSRFLAWGMPWAAIFSGCVFSSSQFLFTSGLARGLMLIGDASYVLYLFHPFLIRANSVLFEKLHLSGVAMCLLYLLGAVSMALVASIFIRKYIEEPFLTSVKRLSEVRSLINARKV